ncbi:hypothetical protein [Stenotrophomonas acidaminiphila]|uniref:hypothetical protein n=1 Tax=Stenotrophomonas acidaminiphila TaxID=128780 RepID=UPI0028A7260E|nr:hypothetical protein [Stenotrophomonas acidaminiphila]
MKLVSQRELIEVFVGAKRLVAQRVASYERHPAMPEETMALFWTEDPSVVQALPFLILVPPSKFKKVAALVASTPGQPFPFSAATRIVPANYSSDTQTAIARRRMALRAVAGLVLAEMSTIQEKVPVAELSLSLLRNSFPFIFGRILSCAGVDGLNESLAVEKSVRELMRDSRTGVLIRSERSHFEMLSVAYELAGGESVSEIGRFCSDLVSRGEASDVAWMKLAEPLGWKVPISQVARMNREDRLGCFLEINEIASGGTALIKEFCAAYMASLISPGTFDHLEMVRARASSGTVSWYGFVAGLHRGGIAVQTGGSVCRKIFRDMTAAVDIFGPVTSDVSALELLGMDSKNLHQLWQLSLSQESIEVEVFPGLSLPFYRSHTRQYEHVSMSSPANKQIDLIPNDVDLVGATADKIDKNISEVVRLLAEVVSLLPSKERAARPRKRTKGG